MISKHNYMSRVIFMNTKMQSFTARLSLLAFSKTQGILGWGCASFSLLLDTGFMRLQCAKAPNNAGYTPRFEEGVVINFFDWWWGMTPLKWENQPVYSLLSYGSVPSFSILFAAASYLRVCFTLQREAQNSNQNRGSVGFSLIRRAFLFTLAGSPCLFLLE